MITTILIIGDFNNYLFFYNYTLNLSKLAMLIYYNVRACNNDKHTYNHAMMCCIRKVLMGNIKYVNKEEMVNFRTHIYNIIIYGISM